ncbi:LamG domain-containing protein [Cytophagaceae bacterium YF14B1]|uniref:LamG domain-containing protein n=1 Tax=Xanthocytophaga flava TaxID=3048013 RepID=A0AAE3QRW4_9BACT|nr:LamG domain-containing protein [Xanthocytophaga flavus]MDJ1484200.1 LamG domain-containing protein [Xanthocytophaga flavus]
MQHTVYIRFFLQQIIKQCIQGVLIQPLPGVVLVLLLLFSQSVQAQTAPPTDGLVMHWALEDGASTTLADGSGNNNTGTLSGTVSSTTAGRVGSCLEAASRTGWTAVTSATGGLNWKPTNFTVSFWIAPYSFGTTVSQLGSRVGWGGFIFYMDNYGGMYVGTDQNTCINPYNIPGAPSVQFGTYQWYHMVFTFTAGSSGSTTGTGRVYKNGVLLGSKAMTNPVTWGGFYMSSATAANATHGKIDEVRIYNRALTDTEVFNLAAYPHGPATAVWKSSPVSTDWSTASNWQGELAPTSVSNIVINSCTTCPVLPSATTVSNFAINTGGKLDLNGQTLTAATTTWTSATIQSNGGTIITPYPSWTNCTFFGALSHIMRQKNDAASSPTGNTFKGPVVVTFESGGGAYRPGWNTYEDTYKFVSKSGSYHWPQGEFKEYAEIRNEGGSTNVAPANFRKEALMYNSSAGQLIFGTSASSVINFYGPVTFTNQWDPTNWQAWITVGTAGNVTFYDKVTYNCSGGRLEFGTTSGVGKVLFKSTASMEKGTSGYVSGLLNFYNVTVEQGTGPMTIAQNQPAVASASISIASSTFNREVSFKSMDVNISGSVFAEKVTFEKTAGNLVNGGISEGRNRFEGDTYFINSSASGQMILGRSYPDIFNGKLFITHGGSSVFGIGYQAAGTQLNEEVTLTTSAGTTGYIEFGGNGGTTLLKDGFKLKTVTFPAGELRLKGFTQLGSDNEQTLSLTGSAGLVFGAGTIFTSVLTATAPRLYLNGSTFKKASTFTKTGTGDNVSIGGNVFNDKVLIRNRASSGTMQMATQVQDQTVKSQ